MVGLEDPNRERNVEKCFKGLRLYSQPFIEEEEQSQGEEGELESLRYRGKGPHEPASKLEEEDCSEAQEASSHGSSRNGENDEQEERDYGEREETVKCSLEGEDFDTKIFFRGRRNKWESQRRRN